MEKAIAWFGARRGRVTYSMVNRFGPNSYDCSSAVYNALIEAGIFPEGTRIGNTETLFNDLEKYGFKKVEPRADGDVDAKRGDVFIWGKRGYSLGASGHTGIMVDADNMIHCNYGYNGITVNNHDQIWQLNGGPAYTFYRYYGTPKPVVLERKAIGGIHTVTERATINGVEQVLAQSLYGDHPDWEANGVAVTAINKVDDQGYWLSGKAQPGEKFVVPGLYVVKRRERDERNGKLYAMLDNVGGYELWVLDSVLTDKETPRPGLKPNPPQPPAEPRPVEKPAPPQPVEKPRPSDETERLARENNGLLKQILGLLQKLVEKITGVFK